MRKDWISEVIICGKGRKSCLFFTLTRFRGARDFFSHLLFLCLTPETIHVGYPKVVQFLDLVDDKNYFLPFTFLGVNIFFQRNQSGTWEREYASVNRASPCELNNQLECLCKSIRFLQVTTLQASSISMASLCLRSAHTTSGLNEAGTRHSSTGDLVMLKNVSRENHQWL